MFGWGLCCCGCDWYDPFEDDLGGYTDYEFTNPPSSEAPEFTVDNGQLSLVNGTPKASGSYFQTVTIPGISDPDFFLRVTSTVFDESSEWTGIFIGLFTAFYARWHDGDYDVYDADSNGQIDTAGGTSITGVPSDGDELAIELYREGGQWVVQYIINGVIAGREEGITPTGSIGETLNIGVMADEGGSWGFLQIECSGEPTLPPDPCDETDCISSGDACITDCDECTDMPGGYAVDFGGLLSPLGGETCCSEAGGWHFLSHVGGCAYRSSEFECGGDSGSYWSLIVKPTNSELKLVTVGGVEGDDVVLIYRREAAIECLCRNAFTKYDEFPVCGDGAPDEVCIIPVTENTDMSCTQCCVIPVAYSVDISGVVPNAQAGCQDRCDEWNKTHVLRLTSSTGNSIYWVDDGGVWPPASNPAISTCCCYSYLIFQCGLNIGDVWALRFLGADHILNPYIISDIDFRENCLGTQVLTTNRPELEIGYNKSCQSTPGTCASGTNGRCLGFPQELELVPRF